MNDARRHVVFDTMSDGVLFIRRGGVVDYINPAAYKILGVSEGISTVTELLDFLLRYEINDSFIDLIVKAISREGETQQALVSYQNQGKEKGAEISVKRLEVKTSYLADEEPGILLIIADVTQREESSANIRDSGIIIASLFGMVFLYALVYTSLQTFWNIEKGKLFLSWTCMSVGTLVCFVTYHYTSLSIAKSGMRLSNVKSGIKISLRYIPIIVGSFFLIKFIVIKLFPGAFPVKSPFFNWSRYLPQNMDLGHFIYPFSVLLQEFLARVFVHENIERIYTVYGKKKAGMAAIVLSSLLFACLHLHQGLLYMLSAFAFSASLGVLYYKSSNFWLVYLVHLIAGDILISLII